MYEKHITLSEILYPKLLLYCIAKVFVKIKVCTNGELANENRYKIHQRKYIIYFITYSHLSFLLCGSDKNNKHFPKTLRLLERKKKDRKKVFYNISFVSFERTLQQLH